ncbi:hypothetical protein [Sinorhizobium meliloti]|uniref:hypothetical protein n=1 Tax=Rhizobium meliloti TaxID=382 RepID=UPI001913088F|nr:hypothetical protein [Sinorhizobium meliloti]
MMWLLRWIAGKLTGDLVGALERAHAARLAAANDAQRIAADIQIKTIEAKMAASAESADVVKEGMQHKVFWIPWLIASVPCAAWFGWGMLDSLAGGSLPDVTTLPPQLKGYADIVFANIFYAGAGVVGVSALAGALKR